MVALKSEDSEAIYVWNLVMASSIKELDARFLSRVGKRADKRTGGKAMKQMVFAIVHNPSRAGTILKDFPGTNRGCNSEWFGNDFGAEYRIDPDIEAAEGVHNEDIGWMPLPDLPGLNAFNKVLDKRSGRYFKVHNRAGGGGTFTVTSAAYPNANNGDDLIAASGGLVRRYVIESKPTNKCGPEDYKLTIQGNRNSYEWVSEHIIELQAVPRFLEFMNQRMIPYIDRDHFQLRPAPLPTSWATPTWSDLRDHINDPAGHMGPYGHLMLSQLGSHAWAENMVVCESTLNGIKARLWGFKAPMSMSKWRLQCSAPTDQAGLRAMSFLQHVLGVLDYLKETTVRARHKSAYEDVRDTLGTYSSHMQSVGGNVGVGYKALWREYNSQHLKEALLHGLGPHFPQASHLCNLRIGELGCRLLQASPFGLPLLPRGGAGQPHLALLLRGTVPRLPLLQGQGFVVA